MKQVIEIPAKLNTQKSKLKVAAYCRVSTDYDEQVGSLEQQIIHFTKIISENEEWELAGIYTEQETGTSIERRGEFRRMLKDCKSSKINLILTKSLSRFGRNTVDTLRILSELEEKDISVYFEIERLESTDKKMRQIISIIASHYQAESEEKSENIKWGIRRSMEKGHVKLNHTQFLGYTRDKNGSLVVVPEEAKIVKLIYDLYLKGCGFRKIKKHLESHNIKTATGKPEWSTSTIDRILSNEKYIGNTLQQKTYGKNFLESLRIKSQVNFENVTQT
jgi:DNA invertase Pin-like site-specific DNA recombinase